MKILCHTLNGFESDLVQVESDIRLGLAGMDIVGLPDSAVKESRERVRVAIRNCGFTFPTDRILVNLAPADLRKQGSGFDLPIALSVLDASFQLFHQFESAVLVCGELELSGTVRPVKGILSAIVAGLAAGIEYFLVSEGNFDEARAVRQGKIYPVSNLTDIDKCLQMMNAGIVPESPNLNAFVTEAYEPDFVDIKGHASLKRVMEISAAGRHHLLLFGPPGSGKTMAAERLVSILPDLSETQSLEVTRIFSLADKKITQLIRRPPFRSPHHSTSREGMTGGGKIITPGEVSLAHQGILFLDEACEFKRGLLQSLREPLETGKITISRAGSSLFFPSNLQLVLAANLCPCGLTGSSKGICLCTDVEIDRYWKRIGGAILDRIDIKFPVIPVDIQNCMDRPGLSSGELLTNVMQARIMQERRNGAGLLNGKLHAGNVFELCQMGKRASEFYLEETRGLGFSSRGTIAVLKVARTIADLEQNDTIKEHHIREALGYRKMEALIWNRKLWKLGALAQNDKFVENVLLRMDKSVLARY